MPDVNVTTAVEKFQRTIRRLSVLRRFAKEMEMEFHIENMEISHFMLQGKKETREPNYVDINNTEFIEYVAGFMKIDCFVPDEEKSLIEQKAVRQKRIQTRSVKHLDRIIKRLPKLDLKRVLKKDKRFREKL